MAEIPVECPPIGRNAPGGAGAAAEPGRAPPYELQRRAHAVLLASPGITRRQLAEHLGVTPILASMTLGRLRKRRMALASDDKPALWSAIGDAATLSKRRPPKEYVASPPRSKTAAIRRCMNCEQQFSSEGKHHRLCNHCRRKSNPDLSFSGGEVRA